MAGQPRKWWGKNRIQAEAVWSEVNSRPLPLDALMAPQFEEALRHLAGLADGQDDPGWRLHWAALREAVRCLGPARLLRDLERVLDDLVRRPSGDDRSPTEYRVRLLIDFVPFDPVGETVSFDLGGAAMTITPTEHGRVHWGHPYPTPDSGAPLGTCVPTAEAELVLQARGRSDALRSAVGAFELWRSCINYLVELGTFGVQFVPGTRAAVPQIHSARVVDASGKEAETHVVNSSSLFGAGGWHDVHASHIDSSRWLLKRLADGHPLNSLIRDAIARFQVALDHSQWYVALLVLWQVAERLTLCGKTGRGHDTAKRLVRLVRPADSAAQERMAVMLRDIGRLRNHVVHRTAFGSAYDSDVQYLKRACCDAILWLLQNRDRYAGEAELQQFLGGKDAVAPSN